MFNLQRIKSAFLRLHQSFYLFIFSALLCGALSLTMTRGQEHSADAKRTGAPPAQTAPLVSSNHSHQDAFIRTTAPAPSDGMADENQSGAWLWILLGGFFLSAVGVSSAVFARVQHRRAEDHQFADANSAARPSYYVFQGGRAFNSPAVASPRRSKRMENATNNDVANASPLPSENLQAGLAPDEKPEKEKVGEKSAEPKNDAMTLMRAPEEQQSLESVFKDQTPSAPPTPPSPSINSFGAFRIEQEVGRLIAGEPHRLDILTSRAPEDRRAIEASLMKCIRNRVVDEDTRRRARMALEEYGFIARRNAALLCAADAFERAAAARMLGEIRSPMALPFLIEALYDAENAVRVEAVVSIGALGLPVAIGALLDAARRCPDIPQSVLQNALTSCSVDTGVIGELPVIEETPQLVSGDEGEAGASRKEIEVAAQSAQKVNRTLKGLRPLSPVQPLPDWVEHETLYEALEQSQHSDVETRVTAAVLLAQFQVQRSVETLSTMALHDPESHVRAAAVTSLGAINHESVFTAILLGLADEAREVRAAAARALSRLTFDRAEAYVRALETLSDRELREVAHTCAKVGLAAQALERLTSADERQGYEARALLALMAKTGYVAPLIQTIESHADINLRLAVVKLFDMIGDAESFEMLRRVAMRGDVPETVRAAIVELICSSLEPGDEPGDETAAAAENQPS